MKAMILAAGRGERMRPLTDHTPKPLLKVGSKCLIEYHLNNLAAAGFKEVVINVAWLGQQVINLIGSGENYHLKITYSDEGDNALETAGGIIKALPLLGDEPFLVINGDVWSDYPLKKLNHFPLKDKAHLVLVDNPPHNPQGDFSIKKNRLIIGETEKMTFSGIGVYSVDFFKPYLSTSLDNKKLPLAPMIRDHIKNNEISAEVYAGKWLDIGTEERLLALSEYLSNKSFF